MAKLTFRGPSASGPSGVFGRIVGTLFFLGFFAIGSFFTYQFGRGIWSGAKTYGWERVPCRILESGVATTTGEQNPYAFQVRYRYEAGGREVEGSTYMPAYEGGKDVAAAERLVARYAPGSDALCWIDPKAPHRSFLERPSPWKALFIFFPLIFVAVGAGGAWAMWASARSGAAATGREALSKSAVPPRKAAGCMAGFFAIFLVAGAGFSLFFVVPAIRAAAARSWPAVPCRVLSSEVRTHSDDDGATYSVDVLYEYEVAGRTYRSNRYQFLGGSSGGYEGKARAVASLPAGSSCTCFVDPGDPHSAVLKRSLGPEYLIVLLPLLFVAVGLGGMVFALRKVRAASPAAGPAAGFSFAAEAAPPGPPSGPVVLKSMGPFGKLVVITLIALFWNAIVGVFLWQMVKAWRGGERPFGLTCFLVPFVVVGIVLLVAVGTSLLATFNPRVKVTLSARAISLGSSATVDWKFSGGASRLTRVEIIVEGREEASYRSGDSTHTDRSIFAKLPVFDSSGSGALASGTATVAIPADTMHSFAAPNNKIVWTLKVRGEIPSWPDVTQDYELDVRPLVERKSGA